MNKHTVLMIIGCVLPLFFIFLAPLLGLSGQASLLIVVIVMFLCHLLMPMHYGTHDSHNKEGSDRRVKRT